MATIKFWQEMQKVVTIDGQDKLMIGKNSTGEAQYVNVEDLNQFLSIQGDSMPAIQGGSTAATAVALPAGPVGQNRWFDASWGYWKYNNVVLLNPNSIEGIPEGSDGVVFWDGTTKLWSISKVQELPVLDTTGSISPGMEKAISGNTAYQNNLYINENTKEIIGYPAKYFEIGSLTGFTSAIPLPQGTVILNKKFTGVNTLSLDLWCTVAGNIVLGSYSINGSNQATRTKFLTISVALGLNRITNFTINEGEYFGFSYNTSSNLGRIGVKNEISTYGHWKVGTNIAAIPTALGAENFNQRLGVTVEIVAINSLSKEVESALKEDDLKIESENIFDINNHVLSGFVVVNTGALLPNAEWAVARIPVSKYVGEKINWGHCLSPRTSMFAIFATSNNVMLAGSSPINFSYLTGGGSGVVPEGAGFIIINIKPPDDLPSVYNTLMVNTGDVLLPFKEYNPEIVEIKGIPLRSTGDGGEAYDQPLNTFNDVEFGSVKTPTLEVVAFQSEAPEWDETGVAPIEVGYEYLFPISAIGYQRRVRRS